MISPIKDYVHILSRYFLYILWTNCKVVIRVSYEITVPGECVHMSSSSMRSIGGWKTISTRVKLIAVVAVLLMVFSSAVCIVGSAEDGSATVQNTKDTAYQTTVVYEPGTPTITSSDYNDTTAPSRSVVYSGNVISTEYNPQVWDYGSETGGSYWYKIKSYSQNNTVVFIGWQYQTGVDSEGAKTWTTATYDPGDVLVYEKGVWYADYTATSKTALYLTDGKIHVKAAWGTVNAYSSSTTDFSDSGGSKYTNFYLPTGNVSSFSGASNCTVRPGISDSSTGSMYNITITMPTANFYDVAIDSTSIYIRYTIYNWHGDYGQGIWANGKTLIFGDGVKCNFNSSLEGNYSYQVGAVYGGSQSSNVASTKLIFHSGIYSDIVGGGNYVSGDTYIVIHEATVTDTLLGAGHYDNDVGGDAWVFATGLKMYGDYYTENALDSNFKGIVSSDGYYLKPYESSVFTGGSNNGSVTNTHVYLSGESAVWDLQAGGRRGHSTVTGIVEADVSGKAMVKHALCGSITDGADGNPWHGSSGNSQSVKNVKLHVRGDAKVANVFGAGYDTFYEAIYSSMYGTDSSIEIDISGGTVGYVYGGGYRGTIGTSGQPLKSIDITISGGKILHDVFGGGRGGVDKTCHNTDGTNNWSESAKDYTGHSEVYTNSLTITVSGGTVDGNVYGGGESVPWLSSSYKITGSAGGTFSIRSGVASTHLCNNGKLSIDLDGGEVKGSVYGAGKGISITDSYVPCIYAMGDSSSVTKITEIPWLSGNNGKDYMNKDYASSTYLDYAKVEGTVSVSVGSSAKVDGSVYGGGAYGIVSGSTDVTVSGTVGTTDSETDGNVYGAGQGVAGSTTTIGQVTTVTKVLITDSANVYNSVYGGGAHGKVTSASKIPVTVGPDATVYKNVYGGGFGSETYTEGDGYVAGSAKVTIAGIVKGNVYGGGAFGVVAGSTDVIVSGTVGTSGSETDGNVYGGGQGLATSNTLGKVGGDATVSISGSALGNVYGGGAYGIVTGSTDVKVTGTGKVGTEGGKYGNVYGAGQGVASSSDVTIGQVATVTEVLIEKGANVYNSVYGGGAHGRVTSDSEIPVTVESGATVYKNVYGGGFGSETYTEGDGYVAGSAKVTIAGIVKGNVYGGGAFGVIGENTTVVINDATVGGTVYAGGLGSKGTVSVNGTRTVHVYGKDTKISGSVYGGSALGNDGTESSKGSDSLIVIDSGSVMGSVFGGGFQGHTYGKTTIYLGTADGSTIISKADSTSEIVISESVYLGGDVGVVKEGYIAYTETMVHNDDPCTMIINGSTVSSISISGSLMGSGNSCLTKGDANIEIINFKPESSIESIHRATNVIIDGSEIAMSGRATVDNDLSAYIMDSTYSLYKITNLTLKNGSTLRLNATMENVGEYHSLNANGDATQKYTPLNKIMIGGGNTLSFRTVVKNSAGTGVDTKYSPVYGYTIITVNGEDGTDFGGYILGSVESTGGFVVYSEGSFKIADYADLTSNARCWFISGTILQEVTVTVGTDTSEGAKNAAQAIVNLPKFQSGTYRYTGGTYITGAPNEKYEMISSADYGDAGSNKFSVRFGYDDERTDIVTFKSGTYLKDFTEFKDEDCVTGDLKDDATSYPAMLIEVNGHFSGSKYVGYVMIYINECREVKDGAGKVTGYVVINSIQTKVNIYSSGSSFDSTDITIGTVDGTGTGQLLIKSGYPGYEVSVESVTPHKDNKFSNVAKLYLESSKNADSTLGWTDSKGELPFYVDGKITTGTVGTLQGGYLSTLLFTVKDFGGTSTVPEVYVVKLKISNGTDVKYLTVNVNISPVQDVQITFNNIEQSGSTDKLSLTYSFRYGSVISEEDCPPGGTNFVGWYTDENFNNPFSYSTPLTKNLNLYALYMYTVTFDYMDGTYSTLHVEKNSYIGKIDDPVRSGYEFEGWFEDNGFTKPWDTETSSVQSDMTLYANWAGVEVTIKFYYYEKSSRSYESLENTGGTIYFGDKYSTSGSALSDAQTAAKKEFPNKKFIYWVYKEQYSSKSDKTYAVYESSILEDWDMLDKDASGAVSKPYTVSLCANLSSVAIQIKMDPSVADDDLNAVIDPPDTFLAFAEDESKTPYTFKIQLNGATRPGYSLSGWWLNSDNIITQTVTGSATHYQFLTGGVIYVKIKELTSDEKPSNAAESYTHSADFSIKSDGDPVLRVGLTKDDYNQICGKGKSDPYTFTFKSDWEQIPYTITIADMENGTIYASYTDESGTPVYFRSATMYYGQTFTLVYTANDGYMFSKWKATGEGAFGNDSLSQTVYTVHSDAVISAYALGPQIVSVKIQIESYADWSVKSEGTVTGYNVPFKLAISKDGSTYTYLTAQAVTEEIGEGTNPNEYFITFTGIANLGLYNIYLVGTDGAMYNLKFTAEATLNLNNYYLIAKDKQAKEVPSGAANVYTGKILHVLSDINDDYNAILSLTEILRKYTVGDKDTEDKNVTMKLKSGYYGYYIGDTIQKGKIVGTETDTDTDVRSDSADVSFILKIDSRYDVETALKLEGKIDQLKNNVYVTYTWKDETAKKLAGNVGYGDLYWTVLETFSDLPTGTFVSEWKIDNKNINSLTVCDIHPVSEVVSEVTVTAVLVSTDTKVDLKIIREDSNGDYSEFSTVTVYADTNKELTYQMVLEGGYDYSKVRYNDSKSEPVTLDKDGLIEDYDVSASTTVTVYINRLTVTIKFREKDELEHWSEFAESKNVRYGAYVDVPSASSSGVKTYGSWAVGGDLSGTIRDNAYQVTLADVNAAKDSSKSFYLYINSFTPRYNVTLITPNGKISDDSGDADTSFVVELVKSSKIEISDNKVICKDPKGSTLYTIDSSDVRGYTFSKWAVPGYYDESKGVESDMTITAIWAAVTYTVNIYYDGYFDSTKTAEKITASVGEKTASLSDLTGSVTRKINGTDYTFAKGSKIENVNYDSMLYIAIQFNDKYTLSTDALKVTNPTASYTKGTDLQHYTVQLRAEEWTYNFYLQLSDGRNTYSGWIGSNTGTNFVESFKAALKIAGFSCETAADGTINSITVNGVTYSAVSEYGFAKWYSDGTNWKSVDKFTGTKFSVVFDNSTAHEPRIFASDEPDKEVNVYLTSMYSGIKVVWNVKYTYLDESGNKVTKTVTVKENDDVEFDSSYKALVSEVDSAALTNDQVKEFFSGPYYLSKWYIESDSKSSVEVKQVDGNWYYFKEKVPRYNVVLTADVYEFKVNDIDGISGTTSKNVTVDKINADGCSLTYDHIYKDETKTETYQISTTESKTTILTITGVEDPMNYKSHGYLATITNEYLIYGSAEKHSVEQALWKKQPVGEDSGEKWTFKVNLVPGTVYIVVDNSFAAKSEIDSEPWDMTKHETYAAIGLDSSMKLKITEWSVDPNPSEKKAYGVYSLTLKYELVYGKIVITNDAAAKSKSEYSGYTVYCLPDDESTTPINVKLSSGFITVNKTGYSSIIA